MERFAVDRAGRSGGQRPNTRVATEQEGSGLRLAGRGARSACKAQAVASRLTVSGRCVFALSRRRGALRASRFVEPGQDVSALATQHVRIDRPDVMRDPTVVYSHRQEQNRHRQRPTDQPRSRPFRQGSRQEHMEGVEDPRTEQAIDDRRDDRTAYGCEKPGPPMLNRLSCRNGVDQKRLLTMRTCHSHGTSPSVQPERSVADDHRPGEQAIEERCPWTPPIGIPCRRNRRPTVKTSGDGTRSRAQAPNVPVPPRPTAVAGKAAATMGPDPSDRPS